VGPACWVYPLPCPRACTRASLPRRNERRDVRRQDRADPADRSNRPPGIPSQQGINRTKPPRRQPLQAGILRDAIFCLGARLRLHADPLCSLAVPELAATTAAANSGITDPNSIRPVTDRAASALESTRDALLRRGAASHRRHTRRPASGSPCQFLELHRAPWVVYTCLIRAACDLGFDNFSPAQRMTARPQARRGEASLLHALK
jgi:hypothetical protein